MKKIISFTLICFIIVLNSNSQKNVRNSIDDAKIIKYTSEIRKDGIIPPSAVIVFPTPYNKKLENSIEQVDNLVDIEWSEIPAGTFTMGSPLTEEERYDGENEHQVTLSAFKMSKYEITFEQYDAFCDATKRAKPKHEGWGRGKRPVINVSWDDATAFAKWMGCRLPTEAEWEYACRAGTSTPFNTGYNLTTSQANYNGNFVPYNNNNKGITRDKTIPVGSFAPNAWGLYDMHGNVFEWCSDWYGDYPTQPQANPTGPSSGDKKIFRGGSWISIGSNVRSAYRWYKIPGNIDKMIGFRIVSSK